MGLARNSLGTFISSVVIFSLRFPIGILIARFLGPEGKGFVYLLIASVSMYATLGSLGLGPAAIYFIGKDRKCLPIVVGNLLAVTVAMSLLISISGLVFLHYSRPDLYAQLPVWMWSIIALMVPFNLMRSLLMQVLSAILCIKAINLLELAATGSQLLLIVLFVVLLDGGIGGAIAAALSSESLAAVGFLVTVMRYCGRPAKPDWPILKMSVGFGIKTYVANLTRVLNLRLDAFLVTTLAANGLHSTGVYSVASGLAELLLFVPQSIRLSLFPMVAGSSATEANRLTSQACRHTAFLTTLAAVLIAVAGSLLIIPLYGSDFGNAITALWLLLPGTMALAQTDVMRGDLIGRGHPEVTAASALVGLVVTVSLDLALIPLYGITGAAIASTSAYITEFVVVTSFFIHYSRLTWREALILRRPDLQSYKQFLNVKAS